MTVHAGNIAHSAAVTIDTGVASKPVRPGPYRLFFKRLVDIFLVVASLPFVLPFIGLFALVISRDGHSPFFLQERVGKDGRRFTMWKFRTMVPNAESMLERHLEENPEARAEWNSKQKLSHDPRCTPIGRILRRTSMDELPQLINVLVGDMSLIGPRPMMPSQQALYPGAAYYKLRPGMTGSWQVSARNESEFADRAKYDDSYHRELSFLGDVSIFAKTLRVVLRGTGL